MQKYIEEYIKIREKKAIEKYKETNTSSFNSILIIIGILFFIWIANNNINIKYQPSINQTINE